MTSAIAAAITQLGVPYGWGKETPGAAFDCSALVQWAYEQAGVILPRTSEAQYSAVQIIPASQAQPGDLVFSEFGEDPGQSGPGHVGIYLGGGQYIDAPHTGAFVSTTSVPKGAVYGRVPGNTNASTAGTNWLADLNPGLALIAGGSSTVSAATSDISSVDGLVTEITSAHFWDRVGLGALGVGLFAIGLVIFFASSDTGQKATSEAASAAPLLAA